MAKLIYAMNQSLDGYVDHDKFGGSDPVLFRHFIENVRGLTGSIYGAQLYEIMRYWDQDDWNQDDPARSAELRAFAEAWRRMPKWVMSRSLKSVGPNATLVGDDFESVIRGLKAGLGG